jgi:predicted metalloprotease with PDZ domain
VSVLLTTRETVLKLGLKGLIFLITCLICSGLLPAQAFQKEESKAEKPTPAEILATAQGYELKRINFYRTMPWDGIRVRGLYEKAEDGELHVRMIVPNSPGERAGIKPGDIIVTMNGKVAKEFSSSSLFHFMTSLEIGEELIYEILRDGKKLTIPVKLTAPTEAVMAEWLLEMRAKKKWKKEQMEKKKKEAEPKKETGR